MEFLRDFIDKVQADEGGKKTGGDSNAVNCGTSEAGEDHRDENFWEPASLERFAEENRFQIGNSLKEEETFNAK